LAGRRIVFGTDRAPARRADAEHIEIVTRHQLAVCPLRLVADAHAHFRVAEGDQPGEDLVQVPVVGVVWVREHGVEEAWVEALSREQHELLRLPDRQRAPEEFVYEAEDGRVRPDAERRHDDGDSRETGALQHHAESVAYVLPECPHRSTSSAAMNDKREAFYYNDGTGARGERSTRQAAYRARPVRGCQTFPNAFNGRGGRTDSAGVRFRRSAVPLSKNARLILRV